VGQLGLGHTEQIGDDEPVSAAGHVPLGGAAVRVVAGAHHACAQLDDGTVRCWGANDEGQLGLGHTDAIGDDETPASVDPTSVGGVVVELTAGEAHTCARLDDGAVRCWGANDAGQLGLGHTDVIGDDERPDAASPLELGGGPLELVAGARHTCALLGDGRVICWGEGLDGRLGYGDESDVGSTVSIAEAEAVDLEGRIAASVFIGSSGASTCVQLDDGAVRCWGLNDVGQLGQGNTDPASSEPTTTPGRIPDIIVVDRDDDE
jgi:alpha-tubulin suppressor-like RCC1 family protein